MVTGWIIILLLFYLQELVSSLGDDVCYHERRNETNYCKFGCCGSTKEKECCDSLSMIIGISIGCVILLATIVAIIVCCIKQQTQNRRRLTPRQSGQVVMVSQAKGPPAYPGLPYESYPAYSDNYKGPMVQPPPSYHLNPTFAPPTYIPPNQQILYGGKGTSTAAGATNQTSEDSPPPPYSSN